MKLYHLGMTICSFFLLACNPLESDISVDELADKGEYTAGMVVDCSTYQGVKSDRVVLNYQEQASTGSLDLRSPGYYRIELYPGQNGSASPRVIRVVIFDKQRNETEWGLPSWTPLGIKTGPLKDEVIRLVHPARIPSNQSFPLVVIAGASLAESTVNLKAEILSNSFLIKRGVGSAWVPAGENSALQVGIDHQNFPITTESINTDPVHISGTLGEDLIVLAGSYVHLPEDLTINAGVSLTFEHGSFVSIAEAVNIHNKGTILFRGLEEDPVTVTCSDANSFWGGVIGTGGGNRVEASHTFFCRSGFHSGEGYDYGHAQRQALFYDRGGTLVFNHCYMTDHVGQVFYPVESTLEINHCLIQRAHTGGQANDSEVKIDHSVFTDFPDDRRVFQDMDNDGFYLAGHTNATISNSIFMYAMDDGLDSGGNKGGEVRVSNTRFESVFHEGAALSSKGTVVKQHYFTNCLFTDCGQGLELGFSSSNHLVTIDSCRFTHNAVGIRYGDNYPVSHQGSMLISNSESTENLAHDVWNMLRETWEADTAKMVFHNVKVSSPDPLYPQLIPYE